MKKENNDAILAKMEELKADLQRTRADFENYRKNTETRVHSAQALGEKKAILAILPMIDDIDRAIAHLPSDLEGNAWAENVVKMSKNLEKSLAKIGVEKIPTDENTPFNPEIHEAVQFDEGGDGEEVVAEELRSGFTKNGEVIRPAMVKVTQK